MPTWTSVASFQQSLSKLEADIKREEARKMATELAKKAQRLAKIAASADLGGDPKFSGWTRSNPIALDTQIKPKRDGAWIMPTKSSAGPWTVAERGRNVGETGRYLGPGLNHRTGVTSRTKAGNIRRRGSKARRWNGVTAGKKTASDAIALMERELPRDAERLLRVAIKKHFDVT